MFKKRQNGVRMEQDDDWFKSMKSKGQDNNDWFGDESNWQTDDKEFGCDGFSSKKGDFCKMEFPNGDSGCYRTSNTDDGGFYKKVNMKNCRGKPTCQQAMDNCSNFSLKL